jgi:hypothetical protein
MKITLEIPDSTQGAYFTFLYGYIDDLRMKSHGIAGKELHDGAVITINVEEGK